MADTIAERNGQGETQATPAPNNIRGKHGYFSKGNPGGPGNPFARMVAAFRAALLNTITGEDIKALVMTLIDSGKKGDTAAARLVLAYALGKPPSSSADDLKAWLPQEETAGPCAEAVDTTPAPLLASAVPPAKPAAPSSQPLPTTRPAIRRFSTQLTDGLRTQPKLSKAQRKKARRLAEANARAKAAENGQQTVNRAAEPSDAPA
jgi:hypothetical protein